MSEQDSANVGRFLDGLDVERAERADEDARRRSQAAPVWEYLTLDTTDTKAGRAVRLVNGDRLEEYRPEHPALAEAGAQGWELVGVVATGGRQEYTLYFKRRRAEG